MEGYTRKKYKRETISKVFDMFINKEKPDSVGYKTGLNYDEILILNNDFENKKYDKAQMIDKYCNKGITFVNNVDILNFDGSDVNLIHCLIDDLVDYEIHENYLRSKYGITETQIESIINDPKYKDYYYNKVMPKIRGYCFSLFSLINSLPDDIKKNFDSRSVFESFKDDVKKYSSKKTEEVCDNKKRSAPVRISDLEKSKIVNDILDNQHLTINQVGKLEGKTESQINGIIRHGYGKRIYKERKADIDTNHFIKRSRGVKLDTKKVAEVNDKEKARCITLNKKYLPIDFKYLVVSYVRDTDDIDGATLRFDLTREEVIDVCNTDFSDVCEYLNTKDRHLSNEVIREFKSMYTDYSKDHMSVIDIANKYNRSVIYTDNAIVTAKNNAMVWSRGRNYGRKEILEENDHRKIKYR